MDDEKQSSAKETQSDSGVEFDPLDGFQANDRFEHTPAPESESESPPLPSLNPIPTGQRPPFYRRNPVTFWFSILIILIYGLTTYSNGFQAPSRLAVSLGAFFGPAVQDGQWWRFLSATLLHGNPGHLFNNVVGLLVFGNMMEPVIGSGRLLGLYAVSMLTGLGLVYLLQPNTVTIGASTIDFGLIGVYFTLVLLLRYQYDRQTFFKEFRGAIGFVLMFVVWNWMESGSVSLWGHVGGFLGGILFGFLLWADRKTKSQITP
ncbi:MAG: rhomboid family intrarane serine protease [Vampirovibrio sp.]|jgi:rhomboid protease GluP|nr:rhomboid family intrarane serine protease [Vampirovibrio sp.]